MKKLFKSAMLIAAAAMAFTSCDKDQIAEDIQINGGKLLTITAGKPEVEDEEGTRTEMDAEKNPLWSVGDQIGVSIAGDNTQYAFDSKTDDGGKTATFTGMLPAEGETTVYAYYPYGADNTLKDAKVVLTLPAEQHPTAVSFDGAADILIAKPESVDMSDENPTISAMRFKRMTGVLSIVLVDSNNLLDGNIKEAKLTVAKPLAGNVELDLVNGTAELAGDNAATTITAVYDEPIDANALHFSVYPQMLEDGSELKLEVVTDNNLSFNKTINIPKPVDIPARKITTIRIAVDKVGKVYNLVTESPKNWTGDYVVGYIDNKTVTVLAATKKSTSSIDVTTATEDFNGSSISGNFTTLHFESIGGGKYYIRYDSDSGSEYIGSDNSSGSNTVFTGTKPNTEDYLWTIYKNEEHIVQITNVKYPNCRFQYNSNKDDWRFASYKGTMKDLSLFANGVAGSDEDEPAELLITSNSSIIVPAEGGEEVVTYSIENYDGNTNATVTIPADAKSWIGIKEGSESFGSVTFEIEKYESTTESRSAEITFSHASVKESKSITITQSAKLDGTKINATIIFSDIYSADTKLKGTKIAVDDVDIVFNNTSGTESQYYTNGTAVRAYAGNTITISSEYVITEVKFTFGTGDGSNAITASSGSFTSPTWTGSEKSVVFTIGGSSGNRRIAAIDVTYLYTGEPRTPEVTVEEPATVAWQGGEVTIPYRVKYPDSNTKLAATSTDSWIEDITVDDDVIKFNVAANTDEEERTGSINVKYGDYYSKTIEITQDAYKDPNAFKTYTLELTAASLGFDSSSYAKNNGDHTVTAKAEDGSAIEVTITSYQVYKQSGDNTTAMQWQKSAGYLQNTTTDLGTIKSLTIASTGGTYTVYEGTAEGPSKSVSASGNTYNFTNGNGFFKVAVGNATGYVETITIVFEK